VLLHQQPFSAILLAVAAPEGKPMLEDYTPHQQKIIKRYYSNQDGIQGQRLAELVSDLYLAEGKKRQRVWQSIATAMQKLGVPQSRIDHLVKQDNPALVAQVVKEIEGKK
jgi:hypothetical protein